MRSDDIIRLIKEQIEGYRAELKVDEDGYVLQIGDGIALVYGVCGIGFAFCTARAVQVAIEHWRQGYSVLERPETAITETLGEIESEEAV